MRSRKILLIETHPQLYNLHIRAGKPRYCIALLFYSQLSRA